MYRITVYTTVTILKIRFFRIHKGKHGKVYDYNTYYKTRTIKHVL